MAMSGQQLLIDADDSAEAEAQRLCRTAKSLAHEVRFERSYKFRPGTLCRNRFLLSLDGPETSLQAVLDAARSIDMPADLEARLEAAYRSPSAVLFGFEQEGDSIVTKLYLEFWEDVVRQVHEAGDRKQPILLNLGLKWRDDHHRITEYTCYPLLSHAETNARIDPIVRPASTELFDVIKNIHRRAARQGHGSTFPYMEATEAAGRWSFDINLYAAQLELGEVDDSLEALAAIFAIDAASMASLKPFRYGQLGHISAGTARDGEPFLTLYFEDRSLKKL